MESDMDRRMEFTACLFAILVLNAADILLTAFAVEHGLAVEGNPAAAALISAIGFSHAAALKLAVVGAVVLACACLGPRLLTSVRLTAAILGTVVVWNLLTLALGLALTAA